MIFIVTVLILAFTLLLAGKDATSYQLKDKTQHNDLTRKRIKRWHKDGVALFLMFTIVLAWASQLYWETALVALLLRLAVYDLAFNKWTGLSLHYLGSTAWWDRFFIRIFGINGALKKSVTFLIILIIFITWYSVL